MKTFTEIIAVAQYLVKILISNGIFNHIRNTIINVLRDNVDLEWFEYTFIILNIYYLLRNRIEISHFIVLL